MAALELAPIGSLLLLKLWLDWHPPLTCRCLHAKIIVCYLRVCVAKFRDAGALYTLGVHRTIGRVPDIPQDSTIFHMYGGLSLNLWTRPFNVRPLLHKQVAGPNKCKL